MIRQDNSLPMILGNIENYNSRSSIRTFLLQTWAQEAINTKYRYFVETLSNGNRIYLERPGRLNKGCDFVIFIENTLLFGNGNDMPPKHNNLLDDLRLKKQTLNPQQWVQLLNSINVIFQCGKYSIAYQHIANLPNNIGLDYELILKISRWFFIEQDITYWAGTGRDMLLQAIHNV